MRFRAGYHAPAAAWLLVVARAGEVAVAARTIPHCSFEVAVAPASVRRGGSMMHGIPGTGTVVGQHHNIEAE